MSTFEEIDFDDIDDEVTTKDDLIEATSDALYSLNFKHIIFMALIFLFIVSDVFIDRVLSRIDGATINKEATTKGTFIQMFILVLMYILFDLLIKWGVL